MAGALAAAGPVLQGVGTIANAYNTYQVGQQKEKEYAQLLREYQDAKLRKDEIDQLNMGQLMRGNEMTSGGYANKMRQQDAGSNYYSMVGR